MNKETAIAIYDILVHICGASADECIKFSFVEEVTKDRMVCEFRFCGKLGFGGKFYWDARWHVSCYAEDSTQEREAIIEKANEMIARLQNKNPVLLDFH